jgi:predicted  nucleic acid-binding Zn-ribbon protein
MEKKIKKTEEKTYKAGEVMSMLEYINDGIGVISEQYKDVVDRLDGIDGRLDKMQGDIDIIKSDIVDIKYDLKDKVSYAEFEKMEKRMVKLEKLVFAKFV